MTYPEGAGEHRQRIEDSEARAERALERATLDIRMAFAQYFAGDTAARVMRAWHVDFTSMRLQSQLVSAAYCDVLDYDGPANALQSLLTGTGDLESLRRAIVDRYVENHADSIADALEGES